MRTCRLGLKAIVVLVAIAGLVTPIASGAEKMDLKLRPKVGEVQKLSALIDQKITQTVSGNQQTIVQKIGLGYSFHVQSVDANGNAQIKVMYENVTFSQQSPAGNIDYDSTKPPATLPPMARGFAAIVGQGFEMRMSPTGKVSDVKGMDQLIEAVLKKLELPEGPAKVAAEKSVRTQFGDEALRENMENMLAIYPDQPVAVGETWQRTLSMTKGFPIKLDNSYTLKEAKEGIAYLDVKSKLSTNADAPPMDMGGAKLSYALSGEQSGSMQVSQATGWVLSVSMTQKASGSMKLDTGSGHTMDIPVQLETTIKLEAK